MNYKPLILVLICFLGISIVNADTNGIFHNAGDIRGGVLGSDEQGLVSFYRFVNPVYVDSDLNITSSDGSNSILRIDSEALAYSGIEFSDQENNIWSMGKDSFNNFYIDEHEVANRLSIQRTTGNIGIGTTSPSQKLEVQGGVSIKHNNFRLFDMQVYSNSNSQFPILYLEKSRSDTIGSLAQTQSGDTLGSLRFHGVTSGGSFDNGAYVEAVQEGETNFRVPAFLRFGTSDGTVDHQERMRITPQGNIGIGTTNPQQKLDINSGFLELDNNFGIRWESASQTTYISGVNGNSGSLQFGTNGGEKARIDSAGNVGIGTTTPIAKLDVVGNVIFDNICDREGNCVNISHLISTLSEGGSGSGGSGSGGSGDFDQVLGGRPTQECLDAGGELEDIGSALPLCRFTASSCPIGWVQFGQWSTTSGRSCPHTTCKISDTGCGKDNQLACYSSGSCSTGQHLDFIDKGQETCSTPGGCCSRSAIITSIGCQ